MIEPILSASLSWLSFVAFTVLPIAFVQLSHWLYDWQILVTGILAVIAARIWGTSIIRAARIEEARSDRLMAKLAPPADQAPPAAEPEAAPVVPLRRPVSAMEDLTDRLQGLRQLIRTSLARIPYTQAPLTADHRALCERIAAVKLDPKPLEGNAAALPHFERLTTDLASLEAACLNGNCRSAWEALVQANVAARSLMGALGEPQAAAASGRL